MPLYNYLCRPCSPGRDPKGWVVWEERHGINAKPKTKCPKCGGADIEKTFYGVEPVPFYTRGYGWLDVKGRRRDMNLWKLQNDDPYKGMRAAGEKDELSASLRKGGKHNSKAKRFFVNPKGK